MERNGGEKKVIDMELVKGWITTSVEGAEFVRRNKEIKDMFLRIAEGILNDEKKFKKLSNIMLQLTGAERLCLMMMTVFDCTVAMLDKTRVVPRMFLMELVENTIDYAVKLWKRGEITIHFRPPKEEEEQR